MSVRRSAAQRRDDAISAGITLFGRHGYSVAASAVARQAGMAEPYLFRLFGTKRVLFLACDAAVHGRVRQLLDATEARGGSISERGRHAVRAFTSSLSSEECRMALRVHCACDDEIIAAVGRERLYELLAQLTRLVGGAPHAARALYGELVMVAFDDVFGGRITMRHLSLRWNPT